MNQVSQKNFHPDTGQSFDVFDDNSLNSTNSINLTNSRLFPNNSNLKTTILQKIQTQKMTNSNYFRIYNIFLILSILVLSILSIFLLAGFLADFGEINEISNDFWVNFWQNSFFEFIILALLIGFLIYLIYRQTDWILVRHKKILISGILIFITFFGILGSFVIKNHLEALQNLENIGYRGNRIADLKQKMKENQVFIGKITEINKSQNWLKVTNRVETKTFYWQNPSPDNSKKSDLSQNLQSNLQDSNDQNFPKNDSIPSIKRNNSNEKPRKNQRKIPKIQNLNPIIDSLEIGQRIFVDFEEIDGKMIIINLIL